MELTHEFRVAVPPAQAWAVLTNVELIAPCLPGAQLQEIEGEEYRGIVKVKVGPITAQYKGKAVFLEQEQSVGRLVLRCEGRDTRGQGNANATITATMAGDGDGTKVTVVTDLTVTGKVAQFGRGVLADVSAKLLGQFVDCLETKVLGGETAAEGADVPSSTAGPSAPSASAPAPSEGALPAAPSVSAPARSEGAAPAAVSSAGPGTATSVVAPTTDGGNGSAPAASAPSVRKVDHPEPAPVDLVETAGRPLAKRAGPAAFALAALIVVVRWRRRRSQRR